MKNLRDLDKITTQEERRQVNSFLFEQLAKQAYSHRRRQQVMPAMRQEENNFTEGDDYELPSS